METIPESEPELPKAPEADKINKHLSKAHAYHAGIVSMRLILKNLSWDGKDKDIINFVKRCEYCIEKNTPKQTKMHFRIPRHIDHYVGIDLMEMDFEEEEYKYIAVIRDMFSGVLHLELLINKTPRGTCRALMKYCSSFGIPNDSYNWSRKMAY
eukprot:NODE_120_length_17920_cov_0.559782.p10 type:complete len:154 gc:universal NODE_120_length_17920_cov_0.559782:10971-11432(+)